MHDTMAEWIASLFEQSTTAKRLDQCVMADPAQRHCRFDMLELIQLTNEIFEAVVQLDREWLVPLAARIAQRPLRRRFPSA